MISVHNNAETEQHHHERKLKKRIALTQRCVWFRHWRSYMENAFEIKRNDKIAKVLKPSKRKRRQTIGHFTRRCKKVRLRHLKNVLFRIFFKVAEYNSCPSLKQPEEWWERKLQEKRYFYE